MSKPLVSDEEIESAWWDSVDGRWLLSSQNERDIRLFARRIEALVRKRLAERLRAESGKHHTGAFYLAARIVESDNE